MEEQLTYKAQNQKKSRSIINIILILFVGISATAVLVLKNKPGALATTRELPADLLNAALQSEQPVIAFFHSNTCDACLQMVAIVDQIYPEFADSITLVDVNVYDEQNRTLINEIGLQFIPTLYFYDTSGNRNTHVGIMEAQQLQKTLIRLSAGD